MALLDTLSQVLDLLQAQFHLFQEAPVDLLAACLGVSLHVDFTRLGAFNSACGCSELQLAASLSNVPREVICKILIRLDVALFKINTGESAALLERIIIEFQGVLQILSDTSGRCVQLFQLI